jgi:succinyl-diaminopimelate desuccinylase
MKGGLAVMMTLAEAQAAAPEASFTLAFFDREEVGYEENGLGPLLSAEPWLGQCALAILLEPTGNVVELGCQGSLHAEVAFTGKAAHSARPWMGENAILRAVPFLDTIRRLPERRVTQGPAEYREVVNVTRAEGGIARNVIPDRFTCNVNLRFAPDRTPEEAVAHLRSLVPPDAEFTVRDLAPAAPARAEDPVVGRFLAAAGLPVRGKQGWTDAARFAGLGVPALNFGPGNPELAHRRDEKAPVTDLAGAYEVLWKFLRAEAAR